MILKGAPCLLAVVALAWSAAGCGEQDPPENPPSPAVGGESSRSLKLKPEMAKQVRLATVEEAVLPVVLRAHGKIQFNEDRTTVVLAPLAGHVRHLAVRVGDSVKEGDPLFDINSRDVAQAISDCLECRKDLDLSEKSYAMTKDLYDHQATSRISLQQAEIDLAKARGRVARNEAQLKTLGVSAPSADASPMTSLIPIVAPLAGTVTERRVNEGQYVPADSTPLVTIADLTSLWVLADVFERDLPLLRKGQKAEVSTIAWSRERFGATVDRVSDVVDPNTRTVKVRLVVANPDLRLKPEMFAEVALVVREDEKALTVPERAVFTEGGESFVFARKGEAEFERRKVEVSGGSEGRLRVRSGLAAGEEVVSQEVLLLRAEESSKDSK